MLGLALLSIADRSGCLLVPHRDDLARYQGVRARVSRVVDGDTIEIELPDPVNHWPFTRIRLWGIDCPESAHDGRPAEPFAAEATARARSLAFHQQVTLRLEPSRTRGSFGRLLAHVQLPDGRSLNEVLLAEGLALVEERWPHSLLERYAQVENDARRHGAGLWAE